jgi:8-oxo-dGTP diphosphatase
MDTQNTVKVGIGVMVIKDGKVLLGKRKGSHGQNQYAWPGGHFEYMESFEQCAKREVMEETGMEIQNIRFVRLLNLKAYAPKHYVDIGIVAEWKSGDPQILEPEKCEGWQWYDLDNLPSPLFAACISTINAYKGGPNFIDN